MNGIPCPDSETLRQALAGEPSACTLLADHLEHCSACVQRAEELDRAFALVPTVVPELHTEFVAQLQHLWTAERQLQSLALLQNAFDPPHAPDELGRIRHFRILEHLASGGMGHVFRAEDTQLQRLVAIKMVAEPLLVDLMQREWTVLAALRHPNIVTVYESGVLADRWPYFVMEYVHGTTLTLYLAEQQLSLRQRIELLRNIALAVGAAHSLRIVHRDLKPGNIMLTTQGDIRILDFGLAREVRENVGAGTAPRVPVVSGMLGTRGYMSPEQAAGQNVDARSDVFALGVILRELLAGTERRSLLTIVAKACANEPHLRYADAGEFAEELTRWLEGYPVQAWPSRWYRTRLFLNRHRRSLSLTAVLTLGALAGIIADSVRIHRERDRTEAKRVEAVNNYRRAKLAVQEYLLTITDDPELMSEGRYELRAKLLDKARVFYEEFLAEGGSDWDVVADHADALTRLATIANALGEKDKALRLLESAASQYEQLRRNAPDRAEDRYACVETYYDLAVQLTAIGRNAEAKQKLTLAEQLLGPDVSLAGRTLYAKLHSQHGWIHQMQGQYADAAREYTSVVAIHRNLIEADPTPSRQRTLASTLLRLGTVRHHQRERSQAKTHFEECRLLREALSRTQPQDTANWRNLAIVYERLARVAIGERQPQTAIRWLTQAQDIHTRLVREQPALSHHRVYAAEHQSKHGTLLRQLGRYTEAEQHFQASLDLIKPLHDAQPTILRWATDMGRVHIEWGYLHHAQMRPNEALASLTKGVGILEQVALQSPSYSFANEVLPRAWATMATLREQQGDTEGAKAARHASRTAEARILQHRDSARSDE